MSTIQPATTAGTLTSGHKRVIIASSLGTVFEWYANPAIEEARVSAPVVINADPQTCSFQFDPIGRKSFTSSCDIAATALTRAGVPYTINKAAPGTVATVNVGSAQISSYEGAA